MGMVGGALSWFATNFLGQPLARFFRLRDEAHSSLINYANVSPVYESDNPRDHPSWEHFCEAHGTFRRLASDIQALALNHPLLNRVLTSIGYQLVDAASGLIGFSNTLPSPQARRRGEVAWNRDLIERSLKFPLSYPNGVEFRDE
jgi:hypothetical protein